MSAFTPLQLLVHELADRFPGCEFIRERDLPAIRDQELVTILNADEYVAQDAFSATAYAEMLDSAIYSTEAGKALAFWGRLKIGAMTSAREFLCSEVNDELCRRLPADEPEMPDTGSAYASLPDMFA